MTKNILFVSSEAEPYAKSGGLADVVTALPKELKKLGANVKIIIPLYSSIKYDKYRLKKLLPSACVHMGTCEEWFGVHYTDSPYGIEVYFIEFNKYFSRNGYYNDAFGEFSDNAYRFSFFCRAAMQVAKDINFKPDIIHVHDWQTSLIPYYLNAYDDPFFKDTKSVLTLHNMGYQGIFPADVLDYAMIKPWDFTSDKFEAFGRVNLLKGGIMNASKLTTVSPKYAEEILGTVGGNGMDAYLNRRRSDLVGILNGIDTEIWNPETDPLITKNFNVSTYKTGKKANKKDLQKAFLLEELPDVPLFSFIGRFAEQKGLHLLRDCLGSIMNEMVCQIIILGSGDSRMESYFGPLPKQYPGRVGSYIGYNESLAHLVEAGSDFFLMPSIYEPCGLNQMYSQVYGTLPIVRAVGGLEDTVEQYNEEAGTGSGFKFKDISSLALKNTIGWAVSTYFDRKSHLDNMIKTAMKLDYSWMNSAKKYMALYDELV